MTQERTIQTRDGPQVVKVHRNHGLSKRCACGRAGWAKCSHPWYGAAQRDGVLIRGPLHLFARWAEPTQPAPAAMSKTDAQRWYHKFCSAVEEGTYRPTGRKARHAAAAGAAGTTASAGGLTFGQVCDEYVKTYVKTPERRPTAAKQLIGQIAQLRRIVVTDAHGYTAALEDRPIDTITTHLVEAIRLQRRDAMQAAHTAWQTVQEQLARGEKRDPGLWQQARLARVAAKQGECGTNRLLTRLRHIFQWAIVPPQRFTQTNPFKYEGEVVVKLNHKAEDPRRRRLNGDEERRLLDAAGDHLRAVIEAALETGCRRGELLHLQWGDVKLDHRAIVLPAAKTKTNVERVVPITDRLQKVLEARPRTDPKGDDLPPTAYVFGDEVGGQVKSIKTAWRLTCQRAGIEGLHFHDLRRECGSRLLESPGVALHEVSAWLGHATTSQTSTYLATTLEKLQDTRKKFDLAQRRQAAKAKKAAKTRAACTSLAQTAKSAAGGQTNPYAAAAANVLH